ncbi:hypothetical protein BJ878DRAFT_539248 [Calycina marina]|uniref:Uncharacterized protein n=1 Tax=Calycina marina TaxID=1763456 RepID=A0A9P7Z8C1_9HELO|nr:hypothetical protein BJ878DRAFT_539248 [Calycina marina]
MRNKSLTIPSWILSKYKVSGENSALRVENSVKYPTESTGIIICTSDGKYQITGNSKLRGTIAQGASGPTISLSESWACKDSGDTESLFASGSLNLTECAGTDFSSPIPCLIYGTLTQQFLLTPAQPSPPTVNLAPTCPDIGNNQ